MAEEAKAAKQDEAKAPAAAAASAGPQAVKMKAPSENAGGTVNGREYVAKGGHIMADVRDVETLISHGFKIVKEKI